MVLYVFRAFNAFLTMRLNLITTWSSISNCLIFYVEMLFATWYRRHESKACKPQAADWSYLAEKLLVRLGNRTEDRVVKYQIQTPSHTSLSDKLLQACVAVNANALVLKSPTEKRQPPPRQTSLQIKFSCVDRGRNSNNWKLIDCAAC
jgi:hypothetical protein